MPKLRIGISGWTYAPWRGVFYPKKLAQRRELEYASRVFNSIEINGTFYSLQRPSSFRLWYEETPPGFTFAIKGGRYITHMRRLKDARQPLANFFAQGLLELKEKLGPILWQLPPTQKFDADRIDAFLSLLPRDTEAAAELASDHDDWMKKRASFRVDRNRKLQYAMEVRHETFKDAAFLKLLRKHNVALCVADTAGRWPFMEDVTADHVYCRLHGDEELYVSGYTDPALDMWAAKIRAWSTGGDAPDAKLHGPSPRKRASRDVYAYFDNDVKVRAPFDAAGLAQRLGLIETLPQANADLDAVTETVREQWPSTGERPLSAKQRSRLASRQRVVPR